MSRSVGATVSLVRGQQHSDQGWAWLQINYLSWGFYALVYQLIDTIQQIPLTKHECGKVEKEDPSSGSTRNVKRREIGCATACLALAKRQLSRTLQRMPLE